MKRTLENAEEDFRIAERENENLRAILTLVLPFAPSDVLATVGRLLEKSIDDGGVTADQREEDDETRWKLLRCGELLGQIASSLEADKEGLFRIAKGLPKDWPTLALQAARDIKDLEPPGKPIMLTAREIAARKAKSSPFAPRIAESR